MGSPEIKEKVKETPENDKFFSEKIYEKEKKDKYQKIKNIFDEEDEDI